MSDQKHFSCTSCSRPCTHVNTGYRKKNISYIGKRERLCDPCLDERRDMIDTLRAMPRTERQEQLKDLTL